MNVTYLTHESPDAFLDFPTVPDEAPEKVRSFNPRKTARCPKCQGHGGWNLRLNAHRLPEGYEDTPENRHKYVHFRSSCQNCNGWGWVDFYDEDAWCIHDYQHQRNVGNCLNEERCSKCGKTVTIDSSD